MQSGESFSVSVLQKFAKRELELPIHKDLTSDRKDLVEIISIKVDNRRLIRLRIIIHKNNWSAQFQNNEYSNGLDFILLLTFLLWKSTRKQEEKSLGI